MRVFPLVAITLTGLICVSGKTIEEKSSEGNASDRVVFAIFPAVAYIIRSVLWEVLLNEVQLSLDLAFLDLELYIPGTKSGSMLKICLDLVHSLDLKHLFMATDKVR